jgi:phosphoribosylaminoimidazole-succinocarboxamide synthase
VIASTSDEVAMADVEKTGALIDLPPELARRSMVIKKADRLDIECVVRNYIAGSAWAEYEESGTMNGEPLPAGMKAADRFAEPVFTPSTKAASGHDMPLTRHEAKDLVGVETHQLLEEKSLEVFQVAYDYAAERGMILVDTKFEFGYVDGELTIIDEVLTPDSSRYWDVNEWAPGNFPPAFDKQFLRAWLLDTDWNREPPPPKLPDEIVEQTQARYLESYWRLSGKSLVL